MKNVFRILIMLLLSFVFSAGLFSQKNITLVVEADQPVCEIQPTLWGLFFEDINFAADGGIYAELVKNRSFEFANPMDGWNTGGRGFFTSSVLIINRGNTYENNPRIARISVNGSTCLENSGFRGMGIHENNEYRFSILASVISGSITINVMLIGSDGTEIGKTVVNPEGTAWQQYESVFVAGKTDAKATLKLCFEGEGKIEIDMVSLFPVQTWKNRTNGLRTDLVQKLADLQPGFLRFPGGCIVEGRDLSKRYQWKNTIGNIENRKLIINRWNDENTRATPDYFQSFGLGFYEYFVLAEDLDAEPVPIVNCGRACQFNTAEVAAIEDMDQYVQDALDLVEFANGPADSGWGKIRAEMGHPEPFNMKYLGIGNEQWGSQYFERYALFEKAFREKHPEIMLITCAGPMASGLMFDNNMAQIKKFSPALVDEHYYSNPEWFFNNATRYDHYDRSTYKIFAGEYAANNVGMASPENRNIWETALAEAAFMTGLERNADVVYMASYAPLLAHTEAWQWTPDLIWFDNLSSYGTPSYYVQKLFSTNSGTDVLHITRNGKPVTGEEGLYATAAWDENAKEIILKMVNRNSEEMSVDIRMNTVKKIAAAAKRIILQSDDPEAMNSMDNPENITPVEDELKIGSGKFTISLQGNSLTVLKIKQK